jgi:hypothetical protein
MLIESLQRLPFQSVFDILFRHEGISGLEKLFPGKSLFLFLGRRDEKNLWAEIICALRVVQRLEHPALALYLLLPKKTSNPDSVSAWSISSRYSDAEWLLPIRRDLMIRAMKVFLPRGERVYDWLDGRDLSIARSPLAWAELAQDCIDSYAFTKRWWGTQGLCWLDGPTMGGAILSAAGDELGRLETALLRMERIRVLEIKRAKRQEGKKEGEKCKTQIVKLNMNEEQCAKSEAIQMFSRHKMVMKEVKSALNSKLSCNVFDSKFQNIARIVMGLTRLYPKMKWSLKLLFHKAASERLDFEPWYVERELCRQSTYLLPDDPIISLRRLC